MNTDKKTAKPASIFGNKNVSRFGYIDEFLFAGEIKGGDHIVYKKARRRSEEHTSELQSQR